MLSWSCSDMPLLSDTIGGLHFAAIDFESAGAARG